MDEQANETGGGAVNGAAANRAEDGTAVGGDDYATAMDVRELERQVERGSMFTQATIQRSFARIEGVEKLLSALIEAVTTKGVVTEEEIGVTWAEEPPVDESDGPAPVPSPFSPYRPAPDDPMKANATVVHPQAGEPAGITWPAISIRVDNPEGLLDPEPDIDCASRMHICKAVCCGLKFPLSDEEVDTGVVKWDIGHPYIIRHNAQGMCVHNNASTGFCGVYEDRPRICRRYSCVNDTRIWKDFDNMILNDEWISQNLGSRNIRVGVVIPMTDSTELWSPGDVFRQDEIS